ncbi:hypothetical protein [Pseudoxanthomonas suwonensis]
MSIRSLSSQELALVSGGATDTDADVQFGIVMARIYHGLTSVESRIGRAIFGPPGAIYGAIHHYRRQLH